jgi:hypothetical protein
LGTKGDKMSKNLIKSYKADFLTNIDRHCENSLTSTKVKNEVTVKKIKIQTEAVNQRVTRNLTYYENDLFIKPCRDQNFVQNPLIM